MSLTKSEPAKNIYGIIDQELDRMHQLLRLEMELHKGTHGIQYGVFMRRILEMQEIILKAAASHDGVIQEKVAEMALLSQEDPDQRR